MHRPTRVTLIPGFTAQVASLKVACEGNGELRPKRKRMCRGVILAGTPFAHRESPFDTAHCDRCYLEYFHVESPRPDLPVEKRRPASAEVDHLATLARRAGDGPEVTVATASLERVLVHYRVLERTVAEYRDALRAISSYADVARRDPFDRED